MNKETEGQIVNCESGPGKLGSLSVSSYSPYSMRQFTMSLWGPRYAFIPRLLGGRFCAPPRFSARPLGPGYWRASQPAERPD